MRAGLLDHVRAEGHAPKAWVKRKSLAKLLAALARTTLDVHGCRALQRAGATHFTQASGEGHPFRVSGGGGGIMVDPGYVRNLELPGSGSILIPRIGGVPLDDPARPVLAGRSDGVVCVRLDVLFLRGLTVPYTTAAELTEWPEVTWADSFTPSMGEIDATEESTGVFAWPLAELTGGRIAQLTRFDIRLTPRITSIF